jgi:hypothetical protein
MKRPNMYGSICMRCGHDLMYHGVATHCEVDGCACPGMVYAHVHEWKKGDKPFTKKCVSCSFEMPDWVPLPLDHFINWAEYKDSELVFSVEQLIQAVDNGAKVITWFDDRPEEAVKEEMREYYERRNIEMARVIKKLRERRDRMMHRMMLDVTSDLSLTVGKEQTKERD